jgi:hypothetical protein
LNNHGEDALHDSGSELLPPRGGPKALNVITQEAVFQFTSHVFDGRSTAIPLDATQEFIPKGNIVARVNEAADSIRQNDFCQHIS